MPMARMSREFSLVLLGSGILTAGYFLYPEDDLAEMQDKKISQQVTGNTNSTTHYRSGGGFMFMYFGGMGGGSSRPMAYGGGSVSRGGFGGIGSASASS
jgi:hypothetical protein